MMAKIKTRPLDQQEKWYLVVSDPSGCFSKNAEFSAFDFRLSLEFDAEDELSCVWPDGMVVRDKDGKFYEVQRGRLILQD